MAVRRGIVVGVDDSPSAMEAVAWAARTAVLRRTPLTVITTMFAPGMYGIPAGVPDVFFDEEHRESRGRLARAEDLAVTVAEDAIDVVTDLCAGTPVSALIEHSKSAEMVVVGTNRRRLVERAFLGSVSSSIVGHAHCPVAVVHAVPQEPARTSGPVVVGVDGSAHSEHAITLAFEEAAARSVELVAVHAWSDVTLYAPFPGDFDWSETETDQRKLLSESMAGRAEDFPDVKVRTVVMLDRPARCLREHSETAQLLVVGSRGRGGFAGMLLGSTSRTLVHSVNCPVVVAR